MVPDDLKSLSLVRYENAVGCLSDAKTLLNVGSYRSAANRCYYAIFHCMRAVLAFDMIDMKRHSYVISEFRRRYIATDILDKQLSPIISALFDMRTSSDYDDFFVVSKPQVSQQVENAEYFLAVVKKYLDTKI